MQKTILIVGGGYAGVAAAKGLLRRKVNARIIVVDQNPSHALPTDYYELVATYVPEKTSINWERMKRCAAVPFAEIFAHTSVEFRQDRLEYVDFKRNVCVCTQSGEQSYDYLLLALGSETNFYDIPRLREYSQRFKTISDVLGARNAIDECFAHKAKHEPIRIVIGGGGFSGCEIAAELVDFINKLADEHSHPRSSISITIVEAGSTLLPGGSSWLQETTKKRLETIGVALIFQKPIKSVTAHEVLFDGLSLPYDILFWTAGVKPNSFFDQWTTVPKEKGCIMVDQTLRLPANQHVFILGDTASCPNPVTGKPEPLTAQVAIQHGRYAAYAIAKLLNHRELRPYRHKEPLLLVPLGGTYALLDLGWIHVRGVTGWILKRAALLNYLLSFLPLHKAFFFWLANTRVFTKKA